MGMGPPTNRMRQFLQTELRPAGDELRGWIAGLGQLLVDALDGLSDFFFSYRRWSAWLRWILICAAGALIWATLAMGWREGSFGKFEPGLAQAQVGYVTCTLRSALSSDPQLNAREQRCYRFELSRTFTFQPLIFEIPFQLLFAPNIFRHVLLIAFGIWLAFKYSARYLSEVYDLPERSCGEHYILQSGLINPYNLLMIQESFVLNNQQHLPVYLIGGPGRVLVNLENAALFEKKDGFARVIGPTINSSGARTWLDGFERLRSILDLRDQREEFEVNGRSQDGIRVSVKNIQVVYSVFRDNQLPTYQRPYPFQDPQAIENLVYGQGRNEWNSVLRVLIRGSFLDFLSRHPLNEFLSLVEPPDMSNRARREDELNRAAQRLVGGDAPEPTPPDTIQGLDFVPRTDITEDFYNNAEVRAQARGAHVDWVGVGTWHFPAQIVMGRHQEAWRITHDNQIRSRGPVMNRSRSQQRLAELLRLIQNVPIATYRTLVQADNRPAEDVLRGLILAYRHQMNEAFQDYGREIDLAIQDFNAATNDADRDALEDRRLRLQAERATVQRVLEYLIRFTARWM